MKIDIGEKGVAMAVMNGLPTGFESLIIAFDALGYKEQILSLDYLKCRLLQEKKTAKNKCKPATYSSSAHVNNSEHTALASHS